LTFRLGLRPLPPSLGRSGCKTASSPKSTNPSPGRGRSGLRVIRSISPTSATRNTTSLATSKALRRAQRTFKPPSGPGAYLRKYFSDVLTPEQISDWVAKVLALACPEELKFTSDPALIRAIYNHVRACMSHEAEQYQTGGLHPLQAYTDSDLQLAYTTNRDSSPSDPIYDARAWVWPEKKIHSRAYGNVKLITNLLAQAGYHIGTLNGAKLKALAPHPSPEPLAIDRSVVCPFIDHLKWAKLDPASATLTLQSFASGATHSVQHTQGLAFPIRTSPLRPYGIGSPSKDYLDSVQAETGETPTHWPDGVAIPPPQPKPKAETPPLGPLSEMYEGTVTGGIRLSDLPLPAGQIEVYRYFMENRPHSPRPGFIEEVAPVRSQWVTFNTVPIPADTPTFESAP
jgi:hypothetical protein